MTQQKLSHVDSAVAVGGRIKELRKQRGLRQNDLAFPGCTPAYISRIEAGARVPSVQLLREIGKRLGVTADYLAMGDDLATSTSAAELALADAQLAQRLGDAEAAAEGFTNLVNSDDPQIRRGALLGLAQLAIERGSIQEAISLLEDFDDLTDPDMRVEPAAVEALAHA